MGSDLGSWRGVLVPLDGSETAARALHPGNALASSMGVPLYTIGVVDQTAGVESAERRMRKQLDDLSIQTAGGHVVADASAIHAIGVDATSRGLLVCMASHGHGRIAGVVLGSVATGVVSQLDEPVVVIGPKTTQGEDQVRLVYVCVDGSPATEAILPAAVALAERTDATIRLVSVVRPTTTVFDLFEDSAEPVPADRYSYLAQLAASSQTEQTVNHQVIKARSVASTIIDLVRSEPGAVVALTSHARHGLGQLMLGSVAGRIVSDSPFPVMLLHSR